MSQDKTITELMDEVWLHMLCITDADNQAVIKALENEEPNDDIIEKLYIDRTDALERKIGVVFNFEPELAEKLQCILGQYAESYLSILEDDNINFSEQIGLIKLLTGLSASDHDKQRVTEQDTHLASLQNADVDSSIISYVQAIRSSIMGH